MKTSLDFNYVKPCLDLLKFKLELLTLGLGVLMTQLCLTYVTNLYDYDKNLVFVIKAVKCSLQTRALLTNEYFPFVFPTNNN